MIIGTCGFGATGSSAVTDYLSEFDCVQVLDNIEFTWVSGQDGLIDLDYHLNHPHSRTADSILAIDRFKKKVESKVRLYRKSGRIDPEVFRASAEKFLDSITQLKWDWYIGSPKGLIGTYVAGALMKRRLIPAMERKLGHRIKCWPMEEVSFSVRPSNFDEAAKLHVKELLTAFGADFSKAIALDQPFSGDNPQACFKFFEDPYAIVVERDPRDLYVFGNTKLIGMTHFMPIQPVEDFVTYYRAIRDGQPYKEPNERILLVQFEDMIYRYDETMARIRAFLHLPENPRPKSVFDPAISMPNTQIWKRFPEFAEDVKYIERELKEYLYDFTGCPEPDPKGKMFKGKSPKHAPKNK